MRKSVVRLPFTLALLALMTTVGIPFFVVYGAVLFIAGYVISPFVLVFHAFNNNRGQFEEYITELNKLPFEIPEGIGEMYKEIIEWGFSLNAQ